MDARARAAHRWPPAATSWSARPGGCATISSASSSTWRAARRRARRGRRDARSGLPRGAEFILDATPDDPAHAAVLGHHPARDRAARPALSARRPAHRHRRPQPAAWRHRIPRHPRGAARRRARHRQRAALFRGAGRAGVLRHARGVAPPALPPARARLRRRGAVRRAEPARAHHALQSLRDGRSRVCVAHRRRRPRAGPARSRPGRPRRPADQPGDAAAPQRAHRAGRPQGRVGADRAASEAPPGRAGADRRPGRRQLGRRRPPPRKSAPATRSACWAIPSSPSRRGRIWSSARAPAGGPQPEQVAAALLRLHASRLPPPEDLADDAPAGTAARRAMPARAARSCSSGCRSDGATRRIRNG